MQKSILIYHNLGLGDHFMCHSIIRAYCARYARIGLICLPHNVASVSFMFRDLKNLTIIPGDDAYARQFIAKNPSLPASERYDEIKIIGFDLLNRRSGVPLEKQFYALAGMDISAKWSGWHLDRDLAREQEVYERYAPKEPYIFLHEDRSRDFTINREKLNPKLTIFAPDPKLVPNAFDYLTLIQRAAEIHVFDSSFMFMIDLVEYDAPGQKLFIHRYARDNAPWKLPILRKKWHIFLLQDYGPAGLCRYARQKLSHAYNAIRSK